MVLDEVSPLKVAVTAIPEPTLALANIPTEAAPDKAVESLPNKPEVITGVPINAATWVAS